MGFFFLIEKDIETAILVYGSVDGQKIRDLERKKRKGKFSQQNLFSNFAKERKFKRKVAILYWKAFK